MIGLVARARGVGIPEVAALLVASLVAALTSLISVQLRTPADRQIPSTVLDTAILVGLTFPVAVLARTTQDRAAWLLVTGTRDQRVVRVGWLAVLVCTTVLDALAIAWLVPAEWPETLICVDLVFLFGCALLGSVLFGAELAWLPPLLVALSASIPGLVPLEHNWLVLAARADELLLVDAGLLLLSGALFTALDDFGVAPARRLLTRVPGVTDE